MRAEIDAIDHQIQAPIARRAQWAHELGALNRVLESLTRHGVSMNRIEWRPAHTGKWQYVFFIDVKGHVKESPLRHALAELGAFAAQVTIPGSYRVTIS